MEEILRLIKEFRLKTSNNFMYIELFDDGSGSLCNDDGSTVFSFDNIAEMIEKLKQ